MKDRSIDCGHVRVAVIDDHPLFRKGLVAILRDEPDLEVAGEAGNAEEARALIGRGDVDLAIVDVLMPAVSGVSIAQEILELAPRCRILALSVIDEPHLVADMLRAGASGYALKLQACETIVDAIRQVAGGVRYLPPGVSREAIDAALAQASRPLSRLTKREREIFELIIRGHDNHDIARQLFISMRTVSTHRQRIVKKLSARSLIDLQRLAARYGSAAL